MTGMTRFGVGLALSGALAAGLAGAAGPESDGITEPVRDSTLSAEVSGTVRRKVREEGEAVRQGDVILELDSVLEELEVARRKLIFESKAEVCAASNRVAVLAEELISSRQLYEATHSVSKEELQKKELEYNVAKGELDRLLSGEEREEVEYKMAAAQLERRRIRAPFDGVVVKILAELGEVCNPQQPLVRVVDVRQCRFVTHVDGSVRRPLKEGMPVTLHIQGAGETLVRRGELVHVSPVVDPSSGLREVRAVFENADGSVKPGVTGRMVVEDGAPR